MSNWKAHAAARAIAPEDRFDALVSALETIHLVAKQVGADAPTEAAILENAVDGSTCHDECLSEGERNDLQGELTEAQEECARLETALATAQRERDEARAAKGLQVVRGNADYEKLRAAAETLRESNAALTAQIAELQALAAVETTARLQRENDGLRDRVLAAARKAGFDDAKIAELDIRTIRGNCLVEDVAIVALGSDGVCPKCGTDYSAALPPTAAP